MLALLLQAVAGFVAGFAFAQLDRGKRIAEAINRRLVKERAL